MSINKIALLIAYQETIGSDSSAAKGMRADALHYRDFLKSSCGGGWDDSEIIVKLSPSANEVSYIIDNYVIGKDYAVIGFFGHGSYSEEDDDILLQINPSQQIPAQLLRNNAPKSLIVLDCCRAISENEVIAEAAMEHLASQRKILDIRTCRMLYDNSIKKADCGNTILYACSPYEKSFGSATGGVYTRSLLRVAEEWEKHLAMTAEYETPYYLSVVKAHNEASVMTEKKQANQHPDIEKNRSGAYLPFAVAFYKEI